MENFEKMIAETVSGKLNDGTVEKLIEEKLEKGISDALDGVFGWRGEVKETIEEKLKEVMTPVIERHDFNNYLTKLDSCLTEIVNNTNLADNKLIMKNFQTLMKEPNIKEIKLSEIFEQYCKHVAENVDTTNLDANCDDGEPYYSNVTANIKVEHEDKSWFKSRFDNCYVNFTCDEDEELNCRIKLFKDADEDKWKILKHMDSIDINSLRSTSDFEIFLSILERSFIKIIMDVEDDYNEDIEPEEKPEWDLR